MLRYRTYNTSCFIHNEVCARKKPEIDGCELNIRSKDDKVVDVRTSQLHNSV